MPGMDGYEVCQKIHGTTANKTTPVIFVTRHSDFNSRSKSTRSGGQDLIGKPFLSFEIALKALTFVLKNRFEHQAKSQATQITPAEVSKAASAANAPQAPQPWLAPSRPLQKKAAGARLEPSLSKPENNTPGAEYSTAFFTRGPIHVDAIRNQIESLAFAADSTERQDILGALFVSTHSLTKNAERVKMRIAARLCAGIEALLKKLFDNQKQINSSNLASINTALDVLEELCGDARHANILNSEVAILVVDDDPIARRAISGAVQLSFGKPDSADSGEEAVARAGEKAYDIIFMDIQMPGMDGFGACAKIRELEINTKTPVVFVTSHSDMESRAKASLAGGDGFISKPTLSAEISLTALTFILRERLRKAKGGRTTKTIQAELVPC
jgi:CheY-like chemotaxis protein